MVRSLVSSMLITSLGMIKHSTRNPHTQPFWLIPGWKYVSRSSPYLVGQGFCFCPDTGVGNMQLYGSFRSIGSVGLGHLVRLSFSYLKIQFLAFFKPNSAHSFSSDTACTSFLSGNVSVRGYTTSLREGFKSSNSRF